MPVAKVTNVSRTAEEFKSKNLWIVGLDERGDKSYETLDYNMDCAIDFGGEGKGLRTTWCGASATL